MKEAIDDIMDTFGGADGGISFINLRTLLERVDKLCENGDTYAQEILETVYKFQRLIAIAQPRKKNE